MPRTAAPQSWQVREHHRHRPVSGLKTRSIPQRGHGDFAAAATALRQHR
ncbi:hypothetical protein [Rhodococcus jostii]|nr:hypothetical protein [Rhodococcus jostii]